MFPTLFTALQDSMTSENHLKSLRVVTSKCTSDPNVMKFLQPFASQKLKDDHYKSLSMMQKSVCDEYTRCQNRSLNIEATAVRCLELMVHCLTNRLQPALVEAGVLADLGNMTAEAQNAMATMGLCCHRLTSHEIINSMCELYEKDLFTQLESFWHNENDVILTVLDNKKFQRWLKRKLIDQDFTQQTASISVLVAAETLHRTTNVDTSDITMVPDWDAELMKDLMHRGIIIPDKLRAICDSKAGYQGLRRFNVVASIAGQSSLQVDVRDKIVGAYLEARLGMKFTPAAVVVDSEIVSLFRNLAHIDPERFKHLILFPSHWHDAKHIKENLSNEPVNMLLLLLPFYVECMQLQCDKKKKQADTLIRRIEAKVLDNSSFSASIPKNLDEPNEKDSKQARQEIHFRRAVAANDSLLKDSSGLGILKLINDYENSDDESNDDDGYGIDNENFEDERGDIIRDADVLINMDREIKESGTSRFSDTQLFSDGKLEYVVNLCYQYCRSTMKGRFANSAFSYKDFKSCQMNYARQQFLIHQLTYVAMENLEELQSIAKNAWGALLVLDLIEEGFHRLAIQPFSSIVINGSASLFVDRLRDSTALLAQFRRDKVVRARFTTMLCMENMFTVHKENGTMYLENCTLSNDLVIELLNSLIARMLSNQPGNPSIELLQQTSLKTMIRRLFIDETASKESAILGEGEILQEEKMISKPSAMRDHPAIKNWLVSYIRRLSHTTIREPLEGVDSIRGLIQSGNARTINDLIPKMSKHMTNIDRKQAGLLLATTGDKNALYRCYLQKFTMDYLKLFSKCLGRRYSLTKERIIDAIVDASTITDFNRFLIDNELKTAAICAGYQLQDSRWQKSIGQKRKY